MRVKQAVSHRFSAKAVLAAGLVCTLTLSGCASWRNQTRPVPPVATDSAATAADADKSAAIANAGAHHDHLVCVTCGRVEEFYDDEIEQRQKMIAETHGYTIVDHALAIYGSCPQCQAARKAS